MSLSNADFLKIAFKFEKEIKTGQQRLTRQLNYKKLNIEFTGLESYIWIARLKHDLQLFYGVILSPFYFLRK